MNCKIIDVSSYQGKPDWSRVKTAGIQGAILRILTSKGMDESFLYNYAACRDVGLPIGVYRYSYALTGMQAKTEAREVLAALKDRPLQLGVWLDLERNRQRALGTATIMQLASVWIETIQESGLPCGIYCNLDWYKNVLKPEILPVRYWIARYPLSDNGTIQESLKPSVGEIAWQYTSKGQVPGIQGYVDKNLWYESPKLQSLTPLENSMPVSLTPSLSTVKSFQKAANADGCKDQNGNPLKEDGIIGFKTRYVMGRTFLKARRISGVYQVGSRGALVRWWQNRLSALGYPVTADGLFGAGTRTATIAFQRTHGLAADGIVGEDTLEAGMSKFL